ncbi:MAG: hypothetical protein IS860_11005, partial [Nitrosopumilus sp.]|nr:hypothetical protein [Nitrosopumilus sp.]
DPSNFDTGSNAVYGITVCASDKRDDGTYDILDNSSGQEACTTTLNTGYYEIYNIVNNDPDTNGVVVDLLV